LPSLVSACLRFLSWLKDGHVLLLDLIDLADAIFEGETFAAHRIELNVSLLFVHHSLQPQAKLFSGVVVHDAPKGALLDADAAEVQQNFGHPGSQAVITDIVDDYGIHWHLPGIITNSITILG